ncbi:MAG TPA: sulfate adenylyltransferase subunit CysN [Candidatus Acidoferrum sp.]|nr:sulfate adenylyltransferase subunit CysN [Candidatus Acidoferrum sp.]
MLAAEKFAATPDFAAFLENDLNKELLRFTTAGSVDDGKSTLIGRLLHDSKSVYEDQLASVKNSRVNRSGRAIDLSLLTDGLRAEREQGITIDVAYRYFSTSRRRFIIADTPGHEEYTRNMATGASTADLAVILVDAAKGLLPQTHRHLYIASLLGIPHVLAAINKMDLVGFEQKAFQNLQQDFIALARRIGIPHVHCAPVSALDGDNVVSASGRMPWYSGPSMLEFLETVEIPSRTEMEAVRFPVQTVIRPHAGFRGFAGRVASGVIHPGDSLIALPSRRQAVVEAIVSYDGELDSASLSQSVVLKLQNEIDLSRGDMLVSSHALPRISNHFLAMVVWLHPAPLEVGTKYLAKHAGRHVKATPGKIRFFVDPNAAGTRAADALEMNGIAAIEFETSSPLFFDPYERNRTTGSFILIDPVSNATLGAGMIREDLSVSFLSEGETVALHPDGSPDELSVERRHERHGHRPAVFSIVGELEDAKRTEALLFSEGFESILIGHDEFSPNSLSRLLEKLLSAGFLIVFWAGPDSSSRTYLPDALSARFLVHNFPPGPQPSTIDSTEVMAVAESLRTPAVQN